MPDIREPSQRWQDAMALRTESHLIELPQSTAQEPLRLALQRFAPTGRAPVGHVLLVHGASAGSRTFMVPDGGLVRHLVSRGWDVWTLDWRGSNLFASHNPKPVRRGASDGQLSSYAERFDLDRSANDDLPAAIERIAASLRQEGHARPIKLSLVSHCIGGAITAMAIGAGCFRAYEGSAAEVHVDNVVLTTLGLFHRVDVDGWLKGNDHVLERLLDELDHFDDPDHPVISPWVASARGEPRAGWPSSLESMYELWLRTPLPHGCGNELCNRASFMFGMPYRAQQLRALHDLPEPEGLWSQFGNMPLKMYMHCVRNLRRGFAAPYDAEVLVPGAGADVTRSYASPEHFVGGHDRRAPRAITLITGAENQVWHRDSIDRMHEWLINHAAYADRSLFTKHVLPGFGHQDLYWSSEAPAKVYGLISAALTHYESTHAAITACAAAQ